MSDRTRADLVARAFLTLGALLPYWRLLTFSVIFVTDDFFTSDIFNGELPGRLLVAKLIRGGQLPLWTGQMCSGYPLVGAPSDPLGLTLFTLLPPAPALDALLIVILLVAAHGTYSLALRLGATRSGAVLAGLAFAGSGYIATQLKHLSIMSTIVWLPVGLVLIDRVFTPVSGPVPPEGTGGGRRRSLLLATLAALFANQVLAGFPQAAYISALVYGSFALFRALTRRQQLGAPRVWLSWLGGIAAALVLGAAAGAVVLLPLAELASVSDRAQPLDYEWATYTNFWPPNVLTFFVPYINGDATDLTYIGPPPFWENYAYAGAATALLAVYGGVRERRRRLVMFLIVMTILAFLFVLGPRTPVYYAAYRLIPGMQRFRAPTRFLVIVDLGLALLAAIGLTRLRGDLERRWKGASGIPRLITVGICAVTAIDLFVHQPRQNPFVPASDWLAAPRTVDVLRADTSAPRTYTPHHRDVHRHTHVTTAHGMTNLEPYFEMRALLAPDTGGGYWNVPSADCYVGLAPRWYVAVWSYHYLENSIIHDLSLQRWWDTPPTFGIRAPLVRLLGMYGVTHVLSPYPGSDPALTLVARESNAYVYRVEGAARVRLVPAARRMASDADATRRLREATFDPDREILLLEAPDSIHPAIEEAGVAPRALSAGRATITRETGRELVIETTAAEDGFLLLADTFYPGWHAQVDGVDTPIYRANISLRGIALPKGQHTVRFTYTPGSFFRGLWITLIALSAILFWFATAAWRTYA
jgi:Bacterial membrane protein YfhO